MTVTASHKMGGDAFLLICLLAAIMGTLALTIFGAIFTTTLFLSYLTTRKEDNHGQQQVVPLHLHRHNIEELR